MKPIILAGILIAALLSACGQPAPRVEASGSSDNTTAEGDITRGEFIFVSGNGGNAPPCTTCHTVGTSAMSLQLGPSLTHIATDGADRISGVDAHDYIRQSILQPQDHVVSGYRVGMYADYEADLSEQELTDLIAFLMTLD